MGQTPFKTDNINISTGYSIDENGNAVFEIVYLGDSGTNGSWRIKASGNDLVFERRESAVWVEKDRLIP